MIKAIPPVFTPNRFSIAGKYFLLPHKSISIKSSGRSVLILLSFLFFIGNVEVSFAQTTYTWNQTGTASWATDVNWTPARTTPATNDILVFNNGATTIATNVPTQTIGSLQVSAGTKLTLNSSGVTAVLTISNGVTGADLSVASGCQLNIAQVTNSFSLTISVATTATAGISGSMDFSSATAGTANQLLAADASGITFNSGATFTQNTNSTGNVFGSSGTANTIIFTSGSTFIQFAGSNPFGLTQPNSKVVFQTGSLFKIQQNAAPSLSGRTYANLEINFASFSQTATGTNPLNVDDLIITLGVLNLNLTGGINIKGNISIASGQTLTFTPASANSININGTSVQTIGSSGTLTFNTNANVVLKSATNTILSQNGSGTFSLAGVISTLSGTTPLTVTGSGSGSVDFTGTANTFTGTISITGAEARFAGNGSFGNAANTIVIDGGRLATTSAATYTLANTHSIQVSNASGNAISATTSGVITYDGIIADKPSTTGAWAKQGAGTLAFGGASTYTGATTINNGILQLTTGNDRLPITTALNIGQAASANLGTLDLNGKNQTFSGINSIAGTNATVTNNTITSSAAATLTINNSGNFSYGDGTNENSGIITGAISLVKTGSGAQTLGDANTYTGTTSVNQGTLIINGNQTGTGAVTIASSATIGGSGTLPGAISLSGIISPGNSPGILTTGAFTFNANSTYKFEISNATGSAGTDWDKIISSGTIDVTASPITIDLTSLSIINFSNVLPFTWVIASGTSIIGFNPANFVINTTNFLPPLGGGSFSITQTGNDINIVFSPVAPPVLTTPTATAITTTDAILGATITYDGGSAITARGTVYKTTTGVTAADNPVAEGGTSTGTFSHLRNGFNPETQYFYAGYATNSSGTGLSPEANFRTLSNPPTAEATTFAATPFSSSQIDLTWTIATFPGSGATANGYIILQRQDATDPASTGILNATAPGALALPSGTVLAATITSGSTATYSNTSLTSSTQYNYLIVPFTWDGTNAATYNYYLPNAPTTNATTLAGLPIVTTPTVANISSTTADLGANVTSNGGNTLTERGTVYKTSTGVTISDNPLAEGGTSIGVFSHTRSSLNPETQYFFKGYATNSNGSSLSSESSFYTFSAPPASEVTGFTGIGVSTSEIDLSWTAATFPGAGATATGYVILRRSDLANPATTGFVNGNNPASLSLPVGTTLVTTITSGATVNFNDTGLGTPNGQYNYLIVPFTWDNVHAVTYNYYLTNAATTFANTLPGIPTLNNPTVTGITESTAVLGANVVSNNGATLTERGTVYKTSTPVLATDNPLAEGGTAIGVYSHTRSSFLPETLYFYAGYAINAGGTGLSSIDSFRTLSNPPISAVTNFLATVFSFSQIDLSWTVAGFPMSGATASGYIILRKIGADPATTGIVNATAPASLMFPVGTTLVTTIISGATSSYSNTGLASNTQYNYLIIPFTWDGVNAATYNYYLINGATANATTPLPRQTFAGDASAFSASKWSAQTTTPCDVSNQTNPFTSGSVAYFCTASGTGTGASITVAGITATESFTLTSAGGTISNQGNGIVTIDVASGKTVDFSTQSFSSSSTAGYSKNNSGTLAFAGNTYGGGFTLNAGTIITRGVNAMGGNATAGPLTLNGGTVAANATRDFSGKYSGITIGGDIQFGSTTTPASGSANLTFSNTVSLGSSMRTLTLGGSGAIAFSGVISNTGSDGITFTSNTNGTGRFDISNTANTFSGPININGDGGTGIAEVRFTLDGSLGNTGNTININGGRLATATIGGTYSITSSRGIQVGNTAGTSISTTSTGTLTYNGIIADLMGSTPGSWAKQGAATLSLGGISTYTGSTTINNGTLLLTSGNDRLPITTTLSIGLAASANLGTLNLNGFNQQLAGLNSISGINATTGNNTVTSAGAATLTLSGSGTYAYGAGTNANSGVITGAISIIKNGSGLQTFGDANTYTGTTAVNQGTLTINGVQTGTGAVTVASTATLGGSGTIPGAISMSGIISPGNSPGTINTGAFTFNTNSTYKFEISNATGDAGTDWDKINANGVVDVSASPITIDVTSISIVNFDNTSNYTWVIATGSSITGFNVANFIINITNFLPPLGGGSFSVSQSGNNLNLVYSPIPYPVVNSPTSASITNVTAVLGANITSDGGSAIAERGTIYKTTPGVTLSDNPLAEGGTSIGVYSHTRSGLNPETQYYYAGYATNNSGTGLSPEANFRTLSNPPTSEATGFAATTISAAQINLTWTIATFPGSGATANGYIILRREDTVDPSTAGIVNATAPASLTLPLGTMLETTIPSGSTNSFANTGLMGLTQYNYLIVPFTWDGTHATTYNYYLTNAPTANATTLPNVPTLNNPTATSIGENSAVLGATIVSNNGSSLTERGTVYKTSSPVTATDNPLAEGGTAVGTFSHTRSSLSPETYYFYAGYAINGGGTGLSNEGNFFTLSTSPTSEVTNFTALAFSATQIDLSWTVASFPMSGASATGYIILRKNGTNPTTDGIIDATEPGSLSLPGGTTLVATITTGATSMYSNTGLIASTQYNYIIVPFTWDGANAATYNYYLTNPPAANATTPNYNQTFAADGSALSASKWSVPSGTSCDVSNQTNPFTSGNIMYFCTPAGTGTGATSTIAGIIATESFSLTSASGNISNLNNGVVTIDIASGKTVDFFTEAFPNLGTVGYIKNNGGAFAFVGGLYGGGFTLNAGTIIARGINAMGGGVPTTGPLTLNAGTVAATTNLNFSNKYSSITIGGDIQFGSTTAPASGSANMTFNTATSLGSALRTFTLGGSGAIAMSGVISNTGSNGITFTANSNGTGRFDINNTANTFSGPININGDGGTGVAEVRLAADGSLGNAGNTININGGRLATLNNANYTITSGRGMQVGNTSGTSISTTGSSTLTYNGVIADLMGSTPGSWAKQGTGTLSLGGISSYTGTTTINNGTLLIATGNDRLPTGTILNMGQAASVNVGVFNLNGFNQQIAGLNSITGINASANKNTVNSTNAATVTFGGGGNYMYGDGSTANSGIITGAISLNKIGSGTQTLGDANTYTGNTTIVGGELRFNPSANTSLTGSLIMNGGILGTSGIADTRTLTFSSFDLSDNSKIDLSTLSDHTITFTVAGTFTSGKTLTIYGWQGTSGMSGTKGKIFFGNSAAGLTVSQLGQIIFNDGTINSPGSNYGGIILSTGEVVPDAAVNNSPTIVMNVISTSDYIDGGAMSSPATPYALSGVISDPTDPFSTLGIDFTVNDAETGANDLVVTGTSSNTSVVPNANIIISGTGTTRNVKVTPTGVGYANITVTVSDGVHNVPYVINYAASEASVNASSTRFFTGTSDASTAQAIDANFMVVGDDQNQVLRLYNRQNSGLPVSGNDYSTALGISMTNPEVDIEGSVKVSNRIYWLGSHSNADGDGALRTNRYRLFATDIAGSGLGTTLSYVGRYDGLRADLIAWDAGNGHGLGADYFGLTASAAAGVIPEAADGSGFNIEGITMAPDNTTAYICFRAPISPASNRTKALIVPVTNLTSLVSGNPSSGPATFGAPIVLDLDGRGIREIMRNASGQYLIIAGPHDAANDFKLYTWTGNAADVPEPRSADLTALQTGGSIESILSVPDPLLSSSVIPLLVDNGATVYYGDGMMANELPNANHKKFRSEVVTLGCSTKVFNANDSGAGSLRDVIACVPEGATVTFVNSLIGSTTTLTSGEILIDKNITISGPALATDLMLSGNNASRIFHVIAGKTLTLKNMSLINANAASPFGGAIYVQGNLTLQNMVLDNNFEDGITPKGITINSPGGLIQIVGSNVQIKE
jgi:autotransporter-associated beta strand protein